MKPEYSGCFISVTSSSSRLQLEGDFRDLDMTVVEGIEIKVIVPVVSWGLTSLTRSMYDAGRCDPVYVLGVLALFSTVPYCSSGITSRR